MLRQTIELAVGETKQVDFGGRLDTARWNGRLLSAFREPFLGLGRLYLTHVETAEEQTVLVDMDGKFAATLLKGSWHVRAQCTGAPTQGFDLGEVAVEADLEQDLIVPGIRLSGRLTPPDEVKGDPLRHSWTLIQCDLVEGEYSGGNRRVNVDAEGLFTIDGLTPGTWHLTIWPGELVGGQPFEVVLGPDDSEAHVTLER